MRIINDIVVEPQVLYQDDLSSLPERGYTEYPDVDAENPGDGFEFVTKDNSDGFSFFTPLLDIVPCLKMVQWYYAFTAVDIQSNLRCRIWEFDNPDNYASY